MNSINFTKIYVNLGKILCGCAGGILAFVLFGSICAIPGVVVGIVTSGFLEQAVLDPTL